MSTVCSDPGLTMAFDKTTCSSGKRIMAGTSAIHCQNCSISQLCIPYTLSDSELNQLDEIIERKRPIHKGDELFKAGEPLKSLFAIRSGTIKSYTITEQGEEQIDARHISAKVIRDWQAQALETSAPLSRWWRRQARL